MLQRRIAHVIVCLPEQGHAPYTVLLFLTVQCTGAPVNISITSSSSRSLTVSWDSPDDPDQLHGNILSYTITCGALSTSNVPASKDVSFDGLLPYSTYNCCVSMETTKANSSAACQEGTTLEEGTVDDRMVQFTSFATFAVVHCSYQN